MVVLPIRSDDDVASAVPLSFTATIVTFHVSPSETLLMVYDVAPASRASLMLRIPLVAVSSRLVASVALLHVISAL